MADSITTQTLVAVLQQLASNPLDSSHLAQLAPIIGGFISELQQVTAHLPPDPEPPLYFRPTEE